MVQFDIELLKEPELIKACFALGKDHYDEVEKQFSNLPYKVNEKLLDALIDANMIVCVGAFDGYNLIGYVGSYITPDLISDCYKAQEIGMYIKKEYRGKGVFKELLKASEEEFSKLGVYESLIMFKTGFSHQIPEGYIETETVYRKRIK